MPFSLYLSLSLTHTHTHKPHSFPIFKMERSRMEGQFLNARCMSPSLSAFPFLSILHSSERRRYRLNYGTCVHAPLPALSSLPTGTVGLIISAVATCSLLKSSLIMLSLISSPSLPSQSKPDCSSQHILSRIGLRTDTEKRPAYFAQPHDIANTSPSISPYASKQFTFFCPRRRHRCWPPPSKRRRASASVATEPMSLCSMWGMRHAVWDNIKIQEI